MKIKYTRLLTVLPLLLALALAGCGAMPGMRGMMGPKFKPLDSEVAAMAAPQPVGAGTSLFCRVGRGQAHFVKSWFEFNDTDFRLTPQSRVNVPLEAKKGGGETAFQALFDLEGQRIVFCPVVEGAPDERISCASIYALDDDLQAGIKRTFDIPDSVAGSSITCAYNEDHFQKL